MRKDPALPHFVLNQKLPYGHQDKFEPGTVRPLNSVAMAELLESRTGDLLVGVAPDHDLSSKDYEKTIGTIAEITEELDTFQVGLFDPDKNGYFKSWFGEAFADEPIAALFMVLIPQNKSLPIEVYNYSKPVVKNCMVWLKRVSPVINTTWDVVRDDVAEFKVSLWLSRPFNNERGFKDGVKIKLTRTHSCCISICYTDV